MSTLVQISGNPGTGKTFSVKSLAEKDPKSVFVINTDGKNLSWAGWRSHFSNENKNYLVSSDAGKIADYLKIITDKKPEIKVVVVDTINTIMSDKEIADRKRPGFDKWAEYASDIYDLYSIANKLRDDLIVIFMAHIEEYQVDGSTFYRTKTGGQKLTKLNLNSKLTYNLYTQVEREGDKPMYYFITQNMGNTEARSTEGVLDIKMPNDLSEVVSRIRKYDLGIEDTN